MTTTTANALEIKARAKALFCETYHYPAVPFRSLGRECFAWAMQSARIELAREAAKAARLAAMDAATKAARLEALRSEIARADFIDSTTERNRVVAAAAAEINTLAA